MSTETFCHNSICNGLHWGTLNAQLAKVCSHLRRCSHCRWAQLAAQCQSVFPTLPAMHKHVHVRQYIEYHLHRFAETEKTSGTLKCKQTCHKESSFFSGGIASYMKAPALCSIRTCSSSSSASHNAHALDTQAIRNDHVCNDQTNNLTNLCIEYARAVSAKYETSMSTARAQVVYLCFSAGLSHTNADALDFLFTICSNSGIIPV